MLHAFVMHHCWGNVFHKFVGQEDHKLLILRMIHVVTGDFVQKMNNNDEGIHSEVIHSAMVSYNNTQTCT